MLRPNPPITDHRGGSNVTNSVAMVLDAKAESTDHRLPITDHLVFLFLVRKGLTLHIIHIFLHSTGDNGSEIGIAAQKPGCKFLCDAEHILHHEHLTVDIGTSPDPNQRYR